MDSQDNNPNWIDLFLFQLCPYEEATSSNLSEGIDPMTTFLASTTQEDASNGGALADDVLMPPDDSGADIHMCLSETMSAAAIQLQEVRPPSSQTYILPPNRTNNYLPREQSHSFSAGSTNQNAYYPTLQGCTPANESETGIHPYWAHATYISDDYSNYYSPDILMSLDHDWKSLDVRNRSPPRWPSILPLPPHQKRQHGNPQQQSQKSGQRRRREKQDSKKKWRQVTKPEACVFCAKGYAFKKDLDRHYLAKHRYEATERAMELKLDVSKINCSVCGKQFDKIRKDNLDKHKRQMHRLV